MTSGELSVLVEKLPEAFEENDRLIAVCQQIASEIELGKTKVHNVVEELGSFLTSTDVSVRSNGVKSLSLILGFLPHEFLKEPEVTLLTAFYNDRLKDHHSIGPSTILGIVALVQMKNLPKDAPTRLVHGIFQHIRCQSELQETRRNIYMILKILLENHLEELRIMGPDFVYGVISSMDGECDPRNLMLLFNILPSFMRAFPLGHLTEEMFEVIACYFPIDFNSSLSGDKRKITREDLAEALASCLYAVPEFAEFCLPHVMEKLDSDRKVAKLDSLHVLSKGVKNFGSKGLKNHLNELWPLLKKEVMSMSDQDLKKAALTTVTEIVKAIADDEELRKNFIEKIFADTRWSLCDVQLSLYWPAEKLLEAVAKAEKKSCVQVLLEVVPLCLGQYSTKTSKDDKVTLMETLNNFIKISLDFNFTIADVPELAWTDIPGLYLKELDTQDNSLKSKALAGLVIQKSFLKEGQRKVVYEKIADIIDRDIFGESRNVCHSSLLAYAKIYPSELLLFLTENFILDIENQDLNVLTSRLEAISALCKISEIGETFLPKIVEIAMSRKSDIDMKALACLYRIVGSVTNTDFEIHDYLYSHCGAIDRLMKCEDTCMKKLTLVSNVCRLIVRKLKIEDQREIVKKYITIEEKDAKNVLLFEGILTPLRQEVEILNIENLISFLSDIVVETETDELRRSSCRIIAVIVNKMTEDSNFERIVKNLRQRIVEICESEETSTSKKKSAIALHTWLTKALIARGSKNSQNFLEYQINLLSQESVGSYVTDEFKTLVDKSENSLTEENFARVKIFYKQRIFQNVIRVNKQYAGESRKNYLVALAHLVEEVPIELPFMHLKELVPLLIESLSLDEGQLLLSTLKTLKLLLETRHEIFVDQIQSFIPKCLQLSTYKKMNVRIAALDCLLSYCNYPTMELLKYRQDVLDKLTEPLDDPKRLVRKIAVKARTRWYLIGSSGGLEN